MLSHDYKQSDDYPSENQRDSLDSHDWRSKLNASLTWDYAQFTSTLFAVRYGSVTNAAGSGRLSRGRCSTPAPATGSTNAPASA